jgi:hypothetical protein
MALITSVKKPRVIRINGAETNFNIGRTKTKRIVRKPPMMRRRSGSVVRVTPGIRRAESKSPVMLAAQRIMSFKRIFIGGRE